jgi:ubiquinone/menaquinone biosynthesis C-methylase UbiE
MKLGDKAQFYEGPEHKEFKELGKEKEKGWDSWGNVLVEQPDGSKERESFYSSPDITKRLFTDDLQAHFSGRKDEELKFADFGGGEGLMLSQINAQLSEAGFKGATPILVEADEKKVKSAKKHFPEIQGTVASIFKLPFKDNSLDAGVSKFMLQYLPSPEVKDRPNQADALKEIHRVLKDGSIFTLVYPAFQSTRGNESHTRTLNELWRLITWHRTFNDEEEPDLKSRSFTPGEEIATVAEQVGFNVKKGEQADWIDFRFGLDTITDRFGEMEPERLELIKDYFNPASIHYRSLKRAGLLTSEDNGKAYIKLPITKLLLEKHL